MKKYDFVLNCLYFFKKNVYQKIQKSKNQK